MGAWSTAEQEAPVPSTPSEICALHIPPSSTTGLTRGPVSWRHMMRRPLVVARAGLRGDTRFKMGCLATEARVEMFAGEHRQGGL